MNSYILRILYFFGGLMILNAAFAGQAEAQDAGARQDSMRSYDLQEIVVRGEERVEERTATVQRLTLGAISQVGATSTAQLAHYIPSAHVVTNSRGETLLYMRSAGERQTAVFFDGALLNVPWDNRLDLGLIPAGIVGGMTVAKGAPAIEYGSNVLGGAVNIVSHSMDYDGSYTEASTHYGNAALFHGHLLHRGRQGAFNYAASFGYGAQDGIPLSDGAFLPFNQTGTSLRTNTDRRIANGFLRGVYTFGSGVNLGVTLLHIDAEQGVAPEGHLPTEDARLWRYPDWRYTTGIVSAEGSGDRSSWKATGWVGDFGQTINAYPSLAFDQPSARQQDKDQTVGSRVVFVQSAGPGSLRLSGNGLFSTHRQRDTDLGEDGEPLAGESFPRFIYSQNLVSLGGAYELPVAKRLQLTLGASYDWMGMSKTGDKPDRDPFSDYSLSFGARYNLEGGAFVRGTVGRKTRFPTMRELFGEALNRFLVNPDLEPESAVLAEVGLGIERPAFRLEIIPFLNGTSNTIDQQNVTIDGTRLRQRINLIGSEVLGVEVTADIQLMPYLNLSGYVTLMNVEPKQATPEDPARLAEKPETLAVGTLKYSGRRGFSALVETGYTGGAYSLDIDDTFVLLDSAPILNARVGYRFDRLARGASIEVFARGENLTDELVVLQLGLPGAGRTVRGGVTVSF